MGQGKKYIIDESEHYQWFTLGFTKDFNYQISPEYIGDTELSAYLFPLCIIGNPYQELS